MKLAVFVKKRSLAGDLRIESLKSELASGGCDVYDVKSSSDLQPGTDMLLSLGGDGTFLEASRITGDSAIPVLGVNFGRLGFLSEHKPEAVVASILAGEYSVDDLSILKAEVDSLPEAQFALNEVTVHRNGAAVLGVDVFIDGEPLPTCWADGFLIATSAGSTAYSLSVGGPICTPDAQVLIIAPIAPHNLNIRPIVVPVGSKIEMRMKSRNQTMMVTMDNRTFIQPIESTVRVSLAQFSLKRVRLGKSNFIQALKNKLFWGEDVRNQ